MKPSPTRGRGSSAAAVMLLAVGLLLALATPFAAPSGAAGAATASTTDGTVWLCRPGLAKNPCAGNLTATAVQANGTKRVQRAVPAANPPIDCFYVYPTVSTQPTLNANLRIDPEERAAATEQAARFSQVCRVFAPMYPQLTLAALQRDAINPRTTGVAYRGVLAAWRDYLAHYNQGRGVVLIGHSQGAALLIGLIKREVDPSPSERRLLVSALLMGGNVAVPVNKVVGGDFAHVPACQTDTQTGCVVAFSTFSSQPSADSSFGRLPTSINAHDGFEPASTKGLQVLCTNPAALSGGTGSLQPYFLSNGSVATPWVTYPGLYRARCRTRGGATWLQVSDVARPGDQRPVVQQTSGPGWGLHDEDVNLTLGNLVALVADESAAYTGPRP
ncbi:MAG TPA: DUF3089 domain-containing protein [Acidimicrobiales bacterium]|nr:DUF3089 domain-containing protein [Acidimicrobiales bacterium]